MADQPTKNAKRTAARKAAPKRNGTPAKPGRPHDLDRPVQFGGTQLPAADAVVAIMSSGEPLSLAARACGLNPDTVYTWRSDGQRIWSQLTEGKLDETKLTDYQAAALRFSEGASRAEAEAEALMAARIGAAAAGGFVQRREVIEYDRDGNELGRKVTEATIPPDPKASMFWLERRASQRWGRAQRIELAAGAEGPVVQTESPLERLSEALAEIEQRRSKGRAQLAAVEITATEEQAAS
jgi:hypothetical protein